jgi:histidyl-tRNA synthetase
VQFLKNPLTADQKAGGSNPPIAFIFPRYNMTKRAQARLPRGFRDIFSEDYKLRRQMLDKIRAVYESYGFEPLETPAVEFAESLGKFLPESDRPDAGIFAFNPEDQWLALRYDLTAPLSRMVAMYKEIPRPFRRYQFGPVWRLEKPGPGRYREFYQFDIDTVGTDSMAADAEICMAMCDSLETLGFQKGEYVIKVNNRKILDDVIDSALKCSGKEDRQNQILDWAKARSKTRDSDLPIKVTPQLELEHKMDIMRCIDKQGRIDLEGINQLLQQGRKDETGDFKSGCFLTIDQMKPIMDFLNLDCSSREKFLSGVSKIVMGNIGREGLKELEEIDQILGDTGYGDDRICFDTQIVRGLTYYTGPVYEVFLTIETTDEKGRPIQFGSVGGGGRYDNLVERFTGQKIAATGASIGVDRLLMAYKNRAKKDSKTTTQVLVTVMDRPRLADYQKMAQELRQAGISAELYLGKKGIGAQTKYADKRGIPVAVIAGEDEFDKGEDLWLGSELAEKISERDKWRKDQPAQIQVPRAKLVEGVRGILGRYR